MEPEEFRNREKKVGGSVSAEISCVEFESPDYSYTLYPSEAATKTGLVKFAELVPKTPDLPTFILRWDERNETLDVDLYANGEITNQLWDEPEYKGHHPQKEEGKPRQFRLDIGIPGKQIFKGTIKVGLRLELNF